jgi:DNA topoisomerase-1
MQNAKYRYHYFGRSFRIVQIPFDLKEFEGKPVSVGVGRFGPYVKWGDAFISLGRGTDPFSVTQEVAENFIKEKKKQMRQLLLIKVNL